MPWRAACLAGELGHKLSGLLPLEAAPVLLIEEADQLLVVGARAAAEDEIRHGPWGHRVTSAERVKVQW